MHCKHMLEDGVSQVFGDPQFVSCTEVRSIVSLHGKVTAAQIHVVVQSRHQTFNGVDARCEGIDGDHALPTKADIRLGGLKQLQGWVDA